MPKSLKLQFPGYGLSKETIGKTVRNAFVRQKPALFVDFDIIDRAPHLIVMEKGMPDNFDAAAFARLIEQIEPKMKVAPPVINGNEITLIVSAPNVT